ncbi:hypothetical protein M8J76_001372 [Diaphorina citri]|nr:hypothetical protein M8J75_000415 [Diaphorina citri]KAI5744332.1 hypothetical protein M8J76_001372 [Diaphorina citri]KAI5752360.1 hypothetical protein M8J77_016321 [Diaphorina citri]
MQSPATPRKSAKGSKTISLSAMQKEQIERNRQRAIQIQQTRARDLYDPYPNPVKAGVRQTASAPSSCPQSPNLRSTTRLGGARSPGTIRSIINAVGSKLFTDTGGGFLLDYDDKYEEKYIKQPAPLLLESEQPTCVECKKKFPQSFLYDKFGHSVCDSCRDGESKHCLVTRTDAKNEYLLKDCDLDKREPVLRFLRAKNPHNKHWGDMKLYLSLQVEQRAIEVWGSEEELEQERERRAEKASNSKLKQYNKKIKALRMAVRSSLFNKISTSPSSHSHQFGMEVHNEEDDTYTRKCSTCDFEETFEKM